MMKKAYRLLIGSVGDDSHSVGMRLLALAFEEAGFFVRNLGILNVLDDFFSKAKDFDAIFISCMNGHVDLFLADFPERLSLFRLTDDSPKVWYLGGNLSVQEGDETVITKYRHMAFDFVAPKPVSLDAIMKQLMRDLHNKGIKKRPVNALPKDEVPPTLTLEMVDDVEMSDQEFLGIRKAILASWPTGREVHTANIQKNHADIHKNFHYVTARSLRNGKRPLVQPRTGVAHVDDEIEILKHLRKNGLDISSVQLDAASRKNLYEKALEGVQRTGKGKKSFLNGFPVLAHGVQGIEKIMSAIDTPFQIRAGSPDHRLVYETALAGGASSVEGGFICYLLPYDKHTSPVENLRYWKYVDKLAHWYLRNYGIVINREYFGPLTCCLIEPVIPISINIVQAILSARSGIKCISVGLAEQGNRSQDIAAIKVLEEMSRQYLAKYGFGDVTISTVFHQYMAAFPTDIEKARDLIFHSSETGTLAGATRMMTKTPVESVHIPDLLNNAEGLNLTHKGIKSGKSGKMDRECIAKEIFVLKREVKALMDTIELLGHGSVARGAIRAFQVGILDIPFSPSIYNRNQLLTAKDCDGAIRFVNPEILPFSEDIIDFHKEKIHQRMQAERSTKIHLLLESDLTRIWKNDFRNWPLDGVYLE